MKKILLLLAFSGCATAGGVFYSAGSIYQCPNELLEKVGKALDGIEQCQKNNQQPPK